MCTSVITNQADWWGSGISWVYILLEISLSCVVPRFIIHTVENTFKSRLLLDQRDLKRNKDTWKSLSVL